MSGFHDVEENVASVQVGHTLPHHTGHVDGIETLSPLDALAAELPRALITYEQSCPVKNIDHDGFDAAVEAARQAQMCVTVVGDRAGLFGLGTSTEGCDAEDLSLPGLQGELVEALLAPAPRSSCSSSPATRTRSVPTRPCGLRPPGVLPQRGERPRPGLHRVGADHPFGQTARPDPAHAGRQARHLPPRHAGRNTEGVSNLGPTPAHPFGHGLSYTTFTHDGFEPSAQETGTDGEAEISRQVRDTGGVPGSEVVQLHTADHIAHLARPVTQLTGFARVRPAPGEHRRGAFHPHTDRLARAGSDLKRFVEPGEVTAMVGASSTDIGLTGTVHPTGQVREAGHDRVLNTPADVSWAQRPRPR